MSVDHHLSPETLRWKIVRDCAFTGAVGVATGFAVFILICEEEASVLQFLGILLVVALFASAFEHIRGVIEGHEHHYSSRSGVIVGLAAVAFLELFITALHDGLSKLATEAGRASLHEIGAAVLGPALAEQTGPIANLVSMGFVWVVVGLTLGVGLAFAVRPAAPSGGKGRGALLGGLVGAVVAPILVFCYVIGARLFLEIKWMITQPDEWSHNVERLYAKIPEGAPLWLVKQGVWLVWKISSSIHGAWGPGIVALVLVVLAVLAISAGREDRGFLSLSIAALPFIVFGIPILPVASASVYNDIKDIGLLLLLVAIVWTIPGLLLGIAVPFLRLPSSNRRFWAWVAWVAACLSVLFRFLVLSNWMLALAGLLAAIGFLFWNGWPIEEFWPVVALSIAILVLGLTNVALDAGFLNIQNLSRVLVGKPLASKAPEKWSFPGRSSKSLLTLGRSMQTLAARSAAISAEEIVVNEIVQKASEFAEEARAISSKSASLPPAATLKNMESFSEVRAELEKILAALEQHEPRIAAEEKERAGLAVPPLLGSLKDAEDFRNSVGWRRLSQMASTLTAAKNQIDQAKKLLLSANEKLDANLQDLRTGLAKRFELCLAGSVGFWLTLGLLAGWRRLERANIHHIHR